MKAICLLSGGMDSTTLAYVAKDQGYEIYALHVNYGQRTERRELQSAKTIAELLEAKEFIEVNLGYLSQFGDSSLTDRSIEVEEYNESRAGIPNTYVPFRNANLLSIATSFAESRKADAVFIGVQSLDYSGYPDCRPQFIEAFQKVVDTGTREDTHIRLLTPFISMTKRDILERGLSLGVPYQHTWSCYQREDMACGVCGSCHFRKEAFGAAGILDPIPYAEE